MKRLYVLIVFAFFILLYIHGQVYGDFYSKKDNAMNLMVSNAWKPSKVVFRDITNGLSHVGESQFSNLVFSERNLSSGYTLNLSQFTPLGTFCFPLNSSYAKATNEIAATLPKTNAFNNINLDSLSGTLTVGTGGNYTTLTGTGGLFEKLNSGQVNGNLTVYIISDLTEVGTTSLNVWKEGKGGPFTLTIHPVGKRIITITSAVILSGTKGVTIDGLNDGPNSLSIERKDGTSSSGVIELAKGASNIMIKRTSISGNNTNCPYVITLLNVSGSTLANDTIIYCSISSANITPASAGIFLAGKTSTVTGVFIDHNIFNNFSNFAIQVINGQFTNTTISNNEIYNTVALGLNDNFYGINLQQGYSGSINIYNNKIHDILCSSIPSGFEISAINCYAPLGILNIYNNLIYFDANVSQPGIAYTGIQIFNSGTTNLNYNTIYIGGAGITANNSYGINVSGTRPVNISNNVVYNARSNSTGAGKHYGIYNGGTVSSNYNDIYVSGTGGCFGYSSKDLLTLSDWQKITSQDLSSLSVNPQFTSVANFLPLNSALCIGTPIAGIKTDIANITRDVSTPTLGAYEFICLNPTTGGIIAADQTVWIPNLPSLIISTTPASGSYGTFEYKWQSSVSPFTIWEDIPTSNSLTYQPAALRQTTQFRRLARSNCMKTWSGAVESNVVAITVLTNKWKGSSDTDWSNPANWTQSIVPAPDADVVFDEDPLHDCQLDKNRSVNNITNNQSLYRLVTNGNTLTVRGNLNFTNSAKIDASFPNSTIVFSGVSFQTISPEAFVNQKIYNLTIDNAAGASIVSDLTIDSLLLINSGTKLTIPTETVLNVDGKIINNAGAEGIIIKSSPTGAVPNGSLMFHNNPKIDPLVQATVEMYSKASLENGTYRWQFFGIPLKSVPANPTFSGSYVREMHEEVTGTTGYWVQLQNESVLTSFTGYEITQKEVKTISFEGELENRDYGPVQLSYTSDATYKGQHLIGNPYTAAINIKDAEMPGNSLTFGEGMDKTVYLYNTGSKADWSSSGLNGGGDSNAAGQYLAIPQESAGVDLLPASIPSMQAFLVMVKTPGTTATISIPYSSTGTISRNSSLQREKASGKVFTRIDVSGPSFGDRMWLFTEPSCTHSFDNGWDGYKIMGNSQAPQIYASETDADYQVSSVDDIDNTYLGFKAGMDTTYTLTFTHQNNDVRYGNIYLLDVKENKTVEITTNGSQYSFNSSSGLQEERRFKIIATPLGNNIVTNLKTVKKEKHSIAVFTSNHAIIVNNQSNLKGNLFLYDIRGCMIQKLQFNAKDITTLPVSLPYGAYLSKAINQEDEVITPLILKE